MINKKWKKTLYRSVLEELHKNTTSIRQMCLNTHISRKSIEDELFRISQVSNMEYWMKWDRQDNAQIMIPLRNMSIDSVEWLIKWLYTKDKYEGKTFKAFDDTKDKLQDGIIPI